jgi:hypothetical protein
MQSNYLQARPRQVCTRSIQAEWTSNRAGSMSIQAESKPNRDNSYQWLSLAQR